MQSDWENVKRCTIIGRLNAFRYSLPLHNCYQFSGHFCVEQYTLQNPLGHYRGKLFLSRVYWTKNIPGSKIICLDSDLLCFRGILLLYHILFIRPRANTYDRIPYPWSNEAKLIFEPLFLSHYGLPWVESIRLSTQNRFSRQNLLSIIPELKNIWVESEAKFGRFSAESGQKVPLGSDGAAYLLIWPRIPLYFHVSLWYRNGPNE